uniref:F-box/kelch-repeat protein At1g57790 n=1 Tax=Anthurium amnicola TaxID=1678845 RepID=A0A1D1YGN6_9ARAE
MAGEGKVLRASRCGCDGDPRAVLTRSSPKKPVRSFLLPHPPGGFFWPSSLLRSRAGRPRCLQESMASPKKLREGGVDNLNRWCHLPRELLELIAGFLDLPDCIRFGSVCAAWRSAASEQRRRRGAHLPLRLPRLLLHRAEPGEARLGFFSTWRQGFLDLDLPEAFGGRSRCCGASWGWLAMVDDGESDICLLNPVTRARIQLPSGSRFPFRPRVVSGGGCCRDPVRYVKKVILSSDPSSGGCTVGAIGRSNMVALCRPGCGDVRWTIFEGQLGGAYEDVAFHGDQICALDFRAKLTICSLAAASSSAPRVTNFAVVDPPEGVEGQRICYRDRHLVASSGELLMVVREYHAGASEAYMATWLRVLKLGMNGWEPVRSLGGRMVFVGEISSESFPGDGVGIPGFRANSICFTRKLVERAMPHAYGTFSMETQYAYPISITVPHLLLEEPVWVMPSLQ